MADLVEKELSYQVNGVLFDVFNELGGGYPEKYYQRAISLALGKKKIKFQEQLMVPLDYEGSSIGRFFIDFLIEGRLILEIKSAPKLYPRDQKQVLSYLQRHNIQIGILANFHRQGLQVKRILRGSVRDNSSS
ncbi:MAG: GxxExxY protein [Candidatus Taylorbacteria bacterium]|nr:GxxExxY protein [Candidatus Taylorbacteria bacterium]